MDLNEYEQIIASEIMLPADIQDGFSGTSDSLLIYDLCADIGGLDTIIDALREAVIYPLTMPHLFQTGKLFGPPKGCVVSSLSYPELHSILCL